MCTLCHELVHHNIRRDPSISRICTTSRMKDASCKLQFLLLFLRPAVLDVTPRIAKHGRRLQTQVRPPNHRSLPAPSTALKVRNHGLEASSLVSVVLALIWEKMAAARNSSCWPTGCMPASQVVPIVDLQPLRDLHTIRSALEVSCS